MFVFEKKFVLWYFQTKKLLYVASPTFKIYLVDIENGMLSWAKEHIVFFDSKLDCYKINVKQRKKKQKLYLVIPKL